MKISNTSKDLTPRADAFQRFLPPFDGMISTEHNPRRALDRIAYQTISSHSLKEVLDTVSRGLTEDMGAAVARVWLLQRNDACAVCSNDEDTAMDRYALHTYASSGASASVDDLFHRLPLCRHTIASVVINRTPVLWTDVPERADAGELEWIQWDGIQSIAAYPLIFRGKVLGLLAMLSRRVLSSEEFEMLGLFAAQATVAIQNALLFEEADRAREDLERQVRERTADLARQAKEAEERSEMLATAIQETHHRVKNNLQAISSLLEMTAMQPGDLRAGMRRVNNQVRAIALVHDFLSKDSDLRSVAVRPVLENLVPMAISSHTRTAQDVKIVIDAEDIALPSKEATSLALVISELVANAVEHGLGDRPHGLVTVRLARECGGTVLEVKDDGRGIPEDFNPARDGHLGTELIQRLVGRHLRGKVEYIRDNGTTVRVTLPGHGQT
ncbi:MAG TPA: histidine kinase dimerization/phosphoacceptor domain -containing protein [Armatimonadota bacterium]|jgi:two-component sensor histidine kinase